MIQVMQGPSVDCQWRYDRDVFLGKFERESVFLENGVVRPAAWAVELGDDRRIILYTNLLDGVFLDIVGQKTTVTTKTDILECGKYVVRL
jgi:hypothetical protein